MNDLITLIREQKTVDSYGDLIAEDTKRNVFCRVESIGQKEFYEAAATGLKPEIKFVLSDYLSYGGEKRLVYHDVPYRVLRTYRKGQKLEIVCYTEVNPT